jgi:hypothetical protein
MTDTTTETPAPVVVDARDRVAMLAQARCFTTDESDAVLLAANAAPLIEWLQAAVSEEDIRARISALSQQSFSASRRDDDPQRFLGGAKTLHAFIYPDGTAA